MPRLLRSDHFGGRLSCDRTCHRVRSYTACNDTTRSQPEAPANKAAVRGIGYLHLRKLKGPLIRLVFDHKLPRSSFQSVKN